MLCYLKWNNYNIMYRKGTMDEYILHEVLNMKCYDVYKEVISNPSVIIDLGAHIGSFTLKTLYDNPQAKMWSWEINPENYNLLQLNVTENNLLDRCKIYNYGAGKYAILRVISSAMLNTGSATLKEVCKNKDEKFMTIVATMDLESIFDITGHKEIDLVKCDIERAELEIFPELSKDIIRRVKCYIMELHNDDSEEDNNTYRNLVNKFVNCGFEYANMNNIFIFRRKKV